MTNLLPCTEWADTLALKPADLPPDKRAALDAHLVTCPGCAATYADYQMLITRLRALPRPALPPAELLALDLFNEQDAQNYADQTYDGMDILLPLPAPESVRPPGRLPRAWRRGWSQRLSLVAAVVLLTVLAGSMALLFHRSPGVANSPEELFRLRPGWTVIAEYSGVGSKTITGQHIVTPRLWGNAYGCIGSGGLDIELNGKSASDMYDMSTHRCGASPLPIVSPETFSFDNTPVGTYDTIKITADAKTRWFFQFAQAPQQPTLTLGPEWIFGTRIGASGNGINRWEDERTTTAHKTWGLVFTCFGTGTGFAELTPDAGKIVLPACDGQPHLSKVYYGVASGIHTISVQVTGDILWDLAVFGCTNEQKCAQD